MSIQQIIQHKHCINCGRAQPTDLQYCSTKCEEEFVGLQNRKKKVHVVVFFIFLVRRFPPNVLAMRGFVLQKCRQSRRRAYL